MTYWYPLCPLWFVFSISTPDPLCNVKGMLVWWSLPYNWILAETVAQTNSIHVILTVHIGWVHFTSYLGTHAYGLSTAANVQHLVNMQTSDRQGWDFAEKPILWMETAENSLEMENNLVINVENSRCITHCSCIVICIISASILS